MMDNFKDETFRFWTKLELESDGIKNELQLIANYSVNNNGEAHFFEFQLEKLQLLKSYFKPKSGKWKKGKLRDYVNKFDKKKKRTEIFYIYKLIESSIDSKLLKSKDDISFLHYLEKLHKENPSYYKNRNQLIPCSESNQLIQSLTKLRDNGAIAIGDKLLSKFISDNFDTGLSVSNILMKIKLNKNTEI